jgi:hypothetical protein
MLFEYTTLAGLKSLARKIQDEHSIPRHQALELAARQGGFAGYVDAKRKLHEQRGTWYCITVRQNWWGYESREGGTAEIILRLNTALPELVRPHHLTGYLGACKIRDTEIIERSGQQRHAGETQWYIGRIARALQFMDATGCVRRTRADATHTQTGITGRRWRIMTIAGSILLPEFISSQRNPILAGRNELWTNRQRGNPCTVGKHSMSLGVEYMAMALNSSCAVPISMRRT